MYKTMSCSATACAASARWPYTWHVDNRDDNRPALQAFATSHLPSPWMGERGAFQVMPALAPPPGGAVSTSPAARALGFSHEDEIARPHDYRVALDGGIRVEMTATDHTVLVRVRFPPGTTEGVLVFDQIEGHGALRLPSPDGATTDAVVRAFTDDGAGPQHDRAASPRASRLALGSSSTTSGGMPNSARARPTRCFIPPERASGKASIH